MTPSPKSLLPLWNSIGFLLYAGLVLAGWWQTRFALFFVMATDACHDPACDADYHVWPAMLTMWIGVGAVLLVTLAGMIAGALREKIVVSWPFAGLLGLGVVFVVANHVVLH